MRLALSSVGCALSGPLLPGVTPPGVEEAVQRLQVTHSAVGSRSGHKERAPAGHPPARQQHRTGKRTPSARPPGSRGPLAAAAASVGPLPDSRSTRWAPCLPPHPPRTGQLVGPHDGRGAHSAATPGGGEMPGAPQRSAQPAGAQKWLSCGAGHAGSRTLQALPSARLLCCWPPSRLASGGDKTSRHRPSGQCFPL